LKNTELSSEGKHDLVLLGFHKSRCSLRVLLLQIFMLSVIEKFSQRYGAKDVKKYYSKFDVAVEVEVG
jgi:hypothetical protein